MEEKCLLNKNLDMNNPAHVIVANINLKNQDLYGDYQICCGLFKNFCTCNDNKK